MPATRIGRIYRIIHRQSDLCYVGSTFNRLSDRMNQHRSKFDRWIIDKTRGACSIYPHFEKHGIDQFDIMLIKEYEVVDRKHLEVYETLWINKLSGCNKNSPFQIKKLAQAAYRAANRDKAVAYYAANRDKIAAYRAANRDKLNEKHNCECGGRYTTNNKPRHERSKRHQRWAANSA